MCVCVYMKSFKRLMRYIPTCVNITQIFRFLNLTRMIPFLVCLLGFNDAFKHLRSYRNGALVTRTSRTLTIVLPHRIAMPQTQDMTPHPVTVYTHRADLSLCYPLMWNTTLEYTITHCNVLGQTQLLNPSPIFHTQQRMLN